MALTVTEAAAVNDLLDFILDFVPMSGRPHIEERAQAAAELLAEHAHKTLMAGVTSRTVGEMFGEIEPRLRAQRVCEALLAHERHGGSIPWPSVSGPFEAWKDGR